MNRTDAAAILSIDPSASPEEVRRAYQELFTEHQVRLTNAPTPALRSLYQARLLELDEARDALTVAQSGEVDSDLPTDQPSIPSYANRESSAQTQTPPPPPPPPRKSSASPPPPPAGQAGSRDARPVQPPPVQPPPRPTEPATQTPPSGGKKKIFIALGFLGAIILFVFLVNLKSGGSGGSSSPLPDSTNMSLADSLPRFRENITVARVEFGRGAYDAADSALAKADSFYAHINPDAASADTGVVKLKEQLDQLHSKVKRACEALRKVAERHPGEPTCKAY